MIQARDPDLVGKPFFARYDPDAVWLSDLEPAFAARFPFESDPEDLPGLLVAHPCSNQQAEASPAARA